jgi:CysZ protein
MVIEMFKGIQFFVQSFGWISHPSIRKYVWASTFISILLFMGLAFGIVKISDWFSDLLSGWIPWDWSGESVLYQWLLQILSFIILLGVFKYILLIITGPLMSIISEKLEYEISPEKRGRVVPGFLSGMTRGIVVNLVNVAKEMIYTIILFVLGFIPGVAIITTPMIFLVQGYFAGYGVMDFYLERYFSYGDSNKIVKREKLFSVTTGIFFVLIFSIPVLGMILAPILGTISSTLYFEKGRIIEKYTD